MLVHASKISNLAVRCRCEPFKIWRISSIFAQGVKPSKRCDISRTARKMMPLAVPSDSCVGEATALVGETFVWMRFSLCFLVTDVFVCEKSLFLVNIGLCDCISGRSQSAGIQGLGTLETTEPPESSPEMLVVWVFRSWSRNFCWSLTGQRPRQVQKLQRLGQRSVGWCPVLMWYIRSIKDRLVKLSNSQELHHWLKYEIDWLWFECNNQSGIWWESLWGPRIQTKNYLILYILHNWFIRTKDMNMYICLYIIKFRYTYTFLICVQSNKNPNF